MPAYRQKYSTAGREVVLPSIKAKKFVIVVSESYAEKINRQNRGAVRSVAGLELDWKLGPSNVNQGTGICSSLSHPDYLLNLSVRR